MVVALALTVSTAALAVRGEPQKQLTPADKARARSILLKKSDLGPGFKPTPQSAAEVDFYCKALDEADLTLTGEAESPQFERGIVFVSSSAQVYGSRADASTSWRRGTTAAGERCAHDVLAGSSRRKASGSSPIAESRSRTSLSGRLPTGSTFPHDRRV